MTKREVLNLLDRHGWIIVKGGKGSHTKVKKGNQTIIVPGHNLGDELKLGTLQQIFKKAGIKR